MFETNEESASAIYNAWKALKIASLPASERDALEITLAAHTPKKIAPKKQRLSNQQLKGVDRYLPTSEEHMALLEVRSTKTSQSNKKKTSGKKVKMEEQEMKTTIQLRNKTSMTMKVEEKGKKTTGQSIKTSKIVKTEDKGKKTTSQAIKTSKKVKTDEKGKKTNGQSIKKTSK